MQKRMLTTFLVVMFILLGVLIFSFATLELGQEVKEEKPEKVKTNPVIKDDGIYFYYYSDDTNENVFLKSSFDNWKYRYKFNLTKEKKGFELKLPIENPDFQFKKGTYKYLLMVNRIFIPDPLSEKNEVNEFGENVSIFKIQNDMHYYLDTPIKLKGKKDTYRFYYRNKKAKFVYLVGDFNNWDPYEIKLELIQPDEGLFMVEYNLFPDKSFYYNFVVDGEWEKDPLNEKTALDRLGRTLSIIKTGQDIYKQEPKKIQTSPGGESSGGH